MQGRRSWRGGANSMWLAMLASLGVIVLLVAMLAWGPGRSSAPHVQPSTSDKMHEQQPELVVYCAAGMRYAMEEIAKQYEQQYGVAIQLQYGGSNTLLSQIEVARTGDLFLAADQSYIRLARERGLAAEVFPLATQMPVIVVPQGNPKQIAKVADLLRDDVTVAFGNPDATAIGKVVRGMLVTSGEWPKLEEAVTARGVFQPTVNEIANCVKLGSVDAGIVWDSTAVQYPELAAITAPELERGTVQIELAVLTCTETPTTALKFARYVAARDAGLKVFQEEGLAVVDGDVWEEAPEIVFFAGAVNRRALEPIIKAFESREGVRVNTVYNGCGILTAQMRTLRQNQDSGFPDAYMACDVYYLDPVRDWFQEDVEVSEAAIVMVVKRGNPLHIQGLKDLLRPDVRLVLGQPEQCTIGVLTKKLLEEAGIYDELTAKKQVPTKPSSAMLVPDVITEAADVTLAYITDALGEPDKLETIRIDSPLAKAVQPYTIARSSEFKNLTRRLYEHVARSRDTFEAAGFTWRLKTTEPPSPTQP